MGSSTDSAMVAIEETKKNKKVTQTERERIETKQGLRKLEEYYENGPSTRLRWGWVEMV